MPLQFTSQSEARTLIGQESFVTEWRNLNDRCGWSTFYQGVEFVQTWFQHYSDIYQPIVILDRLPNGTLSHLLLLAHDVESGLVTVPGAHQAEYQCWLSSGDGDDTFLADAFAALSERLPLTQLRFKFLPAILMENIRDVLDRMSIPWTLREEECPIVDLAEEPWTSLRKKSNKSKLSRLRKAGPLELKILTCPHDNELDGLDAAVRAVAPMYDLRQGATSNTSPFLEDDNKLPFHLSLLAKADDFKAITLNSGDDTIAALIGPLKDGIFSVGVFAHTPFLARHSPGKFILLLAEQALSEEGATEVDLTPGGDWKWRFANGKKTVGELTFFLNQTAYRKTLYKEKAEQAAKSLLAVVGMTPGSARNAVNLLKSLSVSRVVNKLKSISAGRQTREFRVYAFPAEKAAALSPPDCSFNTDSMDDFLQFQPTESWHTRQAFLGSVIGRFESGVKGYSFAKDGVLLHSGWLVPRQKESFFDEVGQRYVYPDNCSVLFDFYTHPSARGQGLYQASLTRMLIDSAHIQGTQQIYISVLADNAPSRHVIEKVGFEYIESVYGRPASSA